MRRCLAVVGGGVRGKKLGSVAAVSPTSLNVGFLAIGDVSEVSHVLHLHQSFPCNFAS